MKKKISKFIAGFLAAALLIPAGIIVPAKATESMTATVTNVTSVSLGDEMCGVFSIDNGKYYGLCAHVGLPNPSVGSSITMTPASPALRAIAYEASKHDLYNWSDITVWNLHEAASEIYSGVHNGGLTSQARNFIAQAKAVSEGKALDGSNIPDTFGAWISNGSGGVQELLVWGMKPTGTLKLIKSSADTSITDGNSCYSLSGAEYEVRNSDGIVVGKLVTGSNGVSNALTLNAGKYTVKETKAPAGYALSNQVYSVTITSGQTYELKVEDLPQNDPVYTLLQKKSTLNGNEETVSAGLEGAEYTYRYYDGQYATAAEAEASGAPTRTWVFKTDKKGIVRFGENALVSGDPLYKDSMGLYTLPIGTLLIHESKAPDGYTLDKTVYVRNITPNGTLENVNSYNEPISLEEVYTGKIQIIKHTNHGLTQIETPEVGATFEVYLSAAGSYNAAAETEREKLTIDENGMACTKDLPYGWYTVHQTSGWEGSELIENFQVFISEDGKTYSFIINNARFYSYITVQKVDARTGEMIPVAGVGFKLYDPEGKQISFRGKDTWYSDQYGIVEFPMQLEYGKKYSVIEQNAPDGYILNPNPVYFDVVKENSAVENELTVITLQVKNMPTQIEISKVDYAGNYVPGATLQVLDASGAVIDEWVTGTAPHALYALPIGSTYTVHEVSAPDGWMLAEDIQFTVGNTAEVQLVSMEDEMVPEISTTATVNDGHEVFAEENVTLIDTVSYRNLVPGKAYVASGALMDKDTGKELLDENGESITASAVFTPETTDGSVDVTFAFSGKLVLGKSVVVFEELSKDGKILATHADLNDEAQTVRFPNLKTSASIDGAKDSCATDTFTLTDTVSYQQLVPGREYTIKGMLMDKNAEKPFLENGQEVCTEVRFIPEATNGTVDVEFIFDARLIKTETSLVVFESLYNGDSLLATHTDINDENQTVKILIPEIGTEATINGKKSATADGEIVIEDTVQYKNLTVGKEYVLKGTLMNKGTGEPIKVDGKDLTAETSFVAKARDGKAVVKFAFDGSLISEKTELVAFEELYREDTLIASHADISDKDQTVSLAPPTPPVKTGDQFNVGLWVALAALAAIGTASALTVVKRKKG